MAVGDIKQFGYWKVSNKSNQDYYYYGTTNNNLTRSIDYSYYNSLKIVDQNIDNESPLKWVEARINNKRVYISVDTVFNYISYKQVDSVKTYIFKMESPIINKDFPYLF